MAALSARATEDPLARLAEDPRCARGLVWIDKNSSWVTDQQIRLTEIPAPEFDEARRAEALKELFAASGFKVSIDRTGNVVAERAGSDSAGVVLLAAHIDTVFPAGTDVRVKRSGSRLVAPGISEALITTAAGLFAAIPALIAYNLFGNDLREFGKRMDDFSLEMLNAVERAGAETPRRVAATEPELR
jgi:hypothetical protein